MQLNRLPQIAFVEVFRLGISGYDGLMSRGTTDSEKVQEMYHVTVSVRARKTREELAEGVPLTGLRRADVT